MQQHIALQLTDLKAAARSLSSVPCCPLHRSLVQQQRQHRSLQPQQVQATSMVNMAAAVLEKLPTVPDAQGRFGKFGGRYVPETLIFALTELEEAYKSATEDPEFQASDSNLVCGFVSGVHRGKAGLPEYWLGIQTCGILLSL